GRTQPDDKRLRSPLKGPTRSSKAAVRHTADSHLRRSHAINKDRVINRVQQNWHRQPLRLPGQPTSNQAHNEQVSIIARVLVHTSEYRSLQHIGPAEADMARQSP